MLSFVDELLADRDHRGAIGKSRNPHSVRSVGYDLDRFEMHDAAIDLVLEKRMGAHGLPLIGTGDWNDGLDEIGSQGRGESVWLGLFLTYILDRFTAVVGRREGGEREAYYRGRLAQVRDAAGAVVSSAQGTGTLVLPYTQYGGAESYTLVIVNQGATDIPATPARDGQKVTLDVSTPEVVGSYAGTLAADGKTIAGTWSQNGQNMALNLTKK